MTEEWKVFKRVGDDIHFKKRVYEVSNFGNVKMNGELQQPYNHYGYWICCGFYVHRAVATLFVPNPENKRYVDHINTDTADNRACNLRWVTGRENSNNPLTKVHMHKPNSPETKRKKSEAAKLRSRDDKGKFV